MLTQITILLMILVLATLYISIGYVILDKGPDLYYKIMDKYDELKANSKGAVHNE